jgi:hypothetical protein
MLFPLPSSHATFTCPPEQTGIAQNDVAGSMQVVPAPQHTSPQAGCPDGQQGFAALVEHVSP